MTPSATASRPRPTGAADPAAIDALLDAVEPDTDPAAIDALLDAVEPDTDPAALAETAEPAASDRSPAGGPEPSRRRTGPVHEVDPPPPVSVTPGPADPWSDRQLLRAVVASVVLTLTGAHRRQVAVAAAAGRPQMTTGAKAADR